MDLFTAASYKVTSAWSGRTAVGGQFFRNLNTSNFSQGQGLARGTESIFGAATTDASDDYVESRSAGGFIDQQMSFRNRLFLTAGLRLDDNSAFGKNFNTKPLPKLSASWLAREQQAAGWLNTLRLRAAYGQSTQQPGTIDALRFYAQSAVRKDAVSGSGVTIANLGNADLKPELSQEIEAGFDAGLFGNRVTLEATYFYKQTSDALIEREIVPSLGTTSTQFFNLGQVSNQGIELRLDTRIIDKPNFAWDLTFSGSLYKNNLDELGEGVAPITLGFIQRHVEGYPLGGIWDRPILVVQRRQRQRRHRAGVYDDAEIVTGRVYGRRRLRGSALPTREFGLRTGLLVLPQSVQPGGAVRLPRRALDRERHRLLPLRRRRHLLPCAGRPHRPARGSGSRCGVHLRRSERLHRVGFLRAGVVHQAPRAVTHFQCTRQHRPGAAGQPASA